MLGTLDRPAIAPSLQKMYEQYLAMSADDLKSELLKALSLSIENLKRAAVLVAILETRGERFEEMEVGGFGILPFLRRIAYGQMLAEVYFGFYGCPSFDRIVSLPIPDQQKCLSTGTIERGRYVEGKVVKQLRPIKELDAAEARQVFAPDHIRSPESQVAYARSREMEKPSAETVDRSPWTVSGHIIVINRPIRLSKKDLQTMLRAIA